LGDYYYLCGIISYYEKFTLSGEVKCIDDEIPFEIPNGWEWCRLGDITSITGGKRVPVGYSLTNQNTGYKYIRVADMKQYSVRNNDVHYISKEIYSLIKNYTISKDDLYITVAGTIGVVGEIPIEFDGANLTENANKIVFTQLNKKCLMYLLSSDYVQTQIKNCTTKVGQPKLAIIRIQNFLLPIPPLKEQQRIVEKIEKLIPHIEHYSKAQTELDLLNKNIKEQLKKSVLQYAIEGKLVPQDETEGTAEVLLEQIQKEKQKLYEENKLKKKDLEQSIIFKAEDNKYYEKIGKNVICIDEEIPFEIPKNWRWVRVKDIVQVNPKNEAADNTISAFIPMEKIKATFSSVYSYSEKKWGEIKSGFTHFSDGDIAFAKITPCFQNRKSMILQNLPNGIGAGTTELKVLRPCGITMNAYFLLFFLESPYFIEEAKFKGTANQQRILSGYLETKLLALPPLTEQQRIVNTIQNIFRCIEN